MSLLEQVSATCHDLDLAPIEVVKLRAECESSVQVTNGETRETDYLKRQLKEGYKLQSQENEAIDHLR